MERGKTEIIDHASAVEAIKQLGEEDLLFLNRLIVERLNLLAQERATSAMRRFTRGERVGFQSPHGQPLAGVVQRLNKKTVSVITDDGQRWNVAPELLHRLSSG